MKIQYKPSSRFSESDIDHLLTWRNQDFVREKMFTQAKISGEEHRAFIQNLKRQKNRALYIAFIDEEPFGVLQYTINNNALEFGYYLIDERYMGSGLGAIMEHSLLKAAFTGLKVDKVYCRTLLENTSVAALHKRFGFSTETRKETIPGREAEIYYQWLDGAGWEKFRSKIAGIVGYIVKPEDIDDLPVEKQDSH